MNEDDQLSANRSNSDRTTHVGFIFSKKLNFCLLLFIVESLFVGLLNILILLF